MSAALKANGSALIMLVTAVAIIVVSLWTRSEVAWAYILGAGFVLTAFWELYSRKDNLKK